MTPYILQAACALIGIALILTWHFFEWGPVSLMAGIFFINIALMTACIDLADRPGFWQPMLRNLAFGVFQIISIVGLLIATVVVGILQRMGFFK